MDLLIGTNTSSPIHWSGASWKGFVCLGPGLLDVVHGGASGAVLSECHLTNHTIAHCAIKATNIQQSIPCPNVPCLPSLDSYFAWSIILCLILGRQELWFNWSPPYATTLLDQRPTHVGWGPLRKVTVQWCCLKIMFWVRPACSDASCKFSALNI